MSTGTKTTSISAKTALSDEVIVNRSGSTALQSVDDLAAQLAGTGAISDAIAAADAGIVRASTTAALNAIPGTRTGQPGEVTTGSGKGAYSWSGTAWVKVGDLIDQDAINQVLTRVVATVTGTGNAMVMTTSPPMQSYVNGQVVYARPPSTNTIAAVTMNVDGLGNANVLGPTGNALRPGDLIGGVLYQFTKFGTNSFRVTAPALAINVARRSGPLLRDYKLADVDITGRVIRGIRRNGTMYLRGVNSSGGGEGADYPRITFQHNIDGTIVPASDIDVGIFVYGQSLGIGYVDSEYYAAAAPYNTSALDGAFMPSVGSLPGDQEFTTYTGLLEQKYATGYASTIETIGSEMAKQIKAEWTAAGFGDHPRIIVAIGGDGGQRIQNLMRGSAYYKQFLDIITRCARVSSDAGKRLVIYAIPFLQGEANRVSSESYFTTRAEYKSYVLQLQRCLEQDIRLITGQIEPVRLLLSMIVRNNGPSEINAAQLDMALTNPDQISIFDCCYAWEHGLQGSHPLVAGYRRGGIKAGRAIVGNVFGNRHRLHRVTRSWLHSATEFRFTTDLPIGATALVKDTSGDLVPTTGMDAGAGWIFSDKDGAVPVSASSVVGSSGRVGTGSVTFGRAVHESSLAGWYAMDGSSYPVDPGNTQRPRGLFRADDGAAVPDLVLPTHSFLLPWSTY